MFRPMCSVSLVERRVNDIVRSSAAAEAAAAIRGNCAEYISDEPPSVKLAGPKYVVLAPDPLEDPERVYCDVVVRKISTRAPEEEWEKLYTKLKSIGSWRKNVIAEVSETTRRQLDPSLDMRKIRQEFINAVTFINRERPAEVDLPEWQERPNEFARRLSLKHLVRMIMDSGIVRSKKVLYTDIFEDPAELVYAPGAIGHANRARFTQESLIEWFFAFDTYSKCIVFIEAVVRYMQAQAGPIVFLLDDIFCDVFTPVVRPSYLSMVRDTPPELTIASTKDVRLLPVTECVKNFLLRNVDVTQFSKIGADYECARHRNTSWQTTMAETILPAPLTMVESIKRILSRRDNETGTISSTDDNDDNGYGDGSGANISSTKRMKRSLPTSDEKRTKRAKEDVSIYSMIEGYEDGVISPVNVHCRREPIIISSHNHLLFPVFDSGSGRSEANILFFVKLRPEAAASLLLPGLFVNAGQFRSGLCKRMERNTSGSYVNGAAGMWKYSLADYCPLKSFTEGISHQHTTSDNGTATTGSRLVDVRQLFF